MNSFWSRVGIRKSFTIFALAFLFNLIWENAHARLYIHYQGSAITQLVLIRAAIFDASFITAIQLLFFSLSLRLRLAATMGVSLVFAVLLEQYALATGRWAYNSLMPMVPVVGGGVTPTIQLALLSGLVILITEKIYEQKN